MIGYKDNGTPENPGSRYIAGQIDRRRPGIYITGDPTRLVGFVDNLEGAGVIPNRMANIIRSMGVHSKK
jgi:hypothetical protein